MPTALLLTFCQYREPHAYFLTLAQPHHAATQVVIDIRVSSTQLAIVRLKLCGSIDARFFQEVQERSLQIAGTLRPPCNRYKPLVKKTDIALTVNDFNTPRPFRNERILSPIDQDIPPILPNTAYHS